jgi:hypothetical protein
MVVCRLSSIRTKIGDQRRGVNPEVGQAENNFFTRALDPMAKSF